MSLKLSVHNIFSEIRDSDKYFIVNLLSGNADLLEKDEAQQIIDIKNTGNYNEESEFVNDLISKGYLVDPVTEKSLFRQKYIDFIDNRAGDEVQIFFVTNYSCNFSCSYCYQDQYKNPSYKLNREVIDAFFSYIGKAFGGRKKYITVFGGEPLLPGADQKAHIEYLISKANEVNLDICLVTNGYTLSEYIPVLRKGRIREVQVTLDGTAPVHDRRRHLRTGGPTFEKIVEGIDACLANNFPVNLRMVTDRENVENLPELAKFAADRGWTGNKLFKTQVGRNYELHHCQSSPDQLFSRISLYETITGIIKSHPEVLDFYKPAYSATKFLSENGSLPDPLFDSCPACKTEWAFDYTGKIYPCTATVGKEDECLGTFYPQVSLDENKSFEWENRDVISVRECNECNLKLACGGGCGSVAKNLSGKICSPDCRPVKELMELGFSVYFDTNGTQ